MFPKQLHFFLKILSIASIICLLLLFYEMPNILREIKPMHVLKLRAANLEKCEFDESVIRRVKFPFRGIAIDSSCPFLDRIRLFNAALDHIRLAHLRRHSKEWKNISSSENIKLIGGADDNFLQQLENFSQNETVFLPWIDNKVRVRSSLEDTSNILLNNYFEWTADEELCQWIKSPRLFMCDIIHN